MATCKYCGEGAGDSEVCLKCRDALGLRLGDGARPRLACARCSHPELVRAFVRELTTGPGEFGNRELVPMAVTYEPTVKTSFFLGRSDGLQRGAPGASLGLLDMFVCRRCGLTEWYCRDPQAIPIGEEYGTELINVDDSSTPYR